MINAGKLADLRERMLAHFFNAYIGGGVMESVFFLELRQNRSYAYIVESNMLIPGIYKNDHTGLFPCSMTTQPGKTIDALMAMDSLVRNMVFVPEFVEQTRMMLINNRNNNYPDFRSRLYSVHTLMKQGFDAESFRAYNNLLKEITIADLEDFYERRIKNAPFVICITADTKQFSPSEFERFGKVRVVKKKEILK